TPVYLGPGGVFRWGLSQVVDTNGNQCNYNWTCDPGNDCYLDSVVYGSTRVQLYRETRPDPITFAVGGNMLGSTNFRLKTVDVTVAGSRLRTYRMMYQTSGTTGRSLLAGVQVYGRDATLDASGNLTSGSTLPAVSFGYSSAGASVGDQTWSGPRSPTSPTHPE